MADEPKQYDWFWYELITGDPEAAARFYSDVVGWTVSPYSTDDSPTYLVGSAGDRGVVGFMARPPQMPVEAPPFWSGYLFSKDVDSTAQAVRDVGGQVYREPFEVPGVGRLAVLADPEGGLFNAMMPRPGGPGSPPKLGEQVAGQVSWCELHSDKPEENFAWYERLFGWQRGEAMDMGPGGTYQMFTTNDQPVTGGSCGKMGGEQRTHWLFYFYVVGMDAAIERVKQGGGRILMGPHEVPGGTFIAIGTDPQGAVFAMNAAER